MKKSSRTLLITIVSFIVLIIVASVAYNALKDNAPSVSFTPELAPVTSKQPTPIPASAPQPAAAEPAPAPRPEAALQPAVEEPVAQSTEAPAAPALEETTPEQAPPSESDAVSASDANTAAPTAPKAEAKQEPTMPDIPLFTLDKRETSFEKVRQGKPVVINYFASWCPPCKQELPHFLKAYEQYKDQISFIFLDAMDGQRETFDTVKKFIKDFPFTAPVYYDEGIFAYMFQTNSLPTTVFINADGTLANGYLGMITESVLEENLQKLLTKE
ncbi:TlpA family protein disulfide reductase [Sphaerochaeta sp.]|uniref:TlpA family protein disulfide reductase n=1 Tax=Sphaerochaeta sp. TaxID=1972642 RepID=UPI002FC9AAC5